MSVLSTEQSMRRPYLYLLAAVAGAGIPALLLANPDVEPLWVLVAVVSIPVLVAWLLKFPAAFIVPVIFVPQVKDWPALAPLQRHLDLTVFFLMLLGVSVLLSLAFNSRGQAGWPVWQRLSGQSAGLLAFLVFAVVVAVSYSYTPAPNYGWRVVSRLWGIGGLLFLAPLLLVREEKDFRHFVSTFLVWAVVLAVAMFGRLDGRAAGEKTELGLIAAGWLMGMAILLALYYRLLERRLPQFLVTLLCLPLLMIGLLASASRGPILSLVPAVVLTTLLNARQQLASRIVKLLGVLALFLLSYAAFSSFVQEMPEAREKFATKTAELARLWGGEMTAGSGGQRLPLYESALQGMSERPFFGLGVGGWSVYHYGRDQVDDPHSLFLQVGAEEGVVGLIALIAFLGTVGAAVRRILAATASRFLVLPGLLLFVVSTSMFSGNIDDDRLLWIWCGMTLAIARMVREWQLLHSPVASQPGQTLGLDSGGRVVS